MTHQTGTVETSHGKIAYVDTGGEGPVAIFVHGNSSSKRIFERQLNSGLAQTYRLIALDLPGHGDSDNAPDPQATYFFAGFASALLEALEALQIEKAALFGWSLGGHIVLEMLARWPGAQSAMILGTPPVPMDTERAMSAFLPSETMGLTFQENFSAQDATTYVHESFMSAASVEPWMIEDALRADGRFRPIVLQAASEGRCLDEEEIVGSCEKPLAVVIGSKDTFVNRDFLTSLTYRNLWGGEVQVLEGCGHAPFWDATDEFNIFLGRFLDETV